MNREKHLQEFVQESQTEILSVLKKLCHIPAPSNHEELRAVYCKQYLESIGAKGAYIDEAFNVIYPMNCEGSDEITAFVAHIDTVFPDMEPMPYAEDDEKIYCPGVGDDTACVVLMMQCIKFMIENDITPKGGVLFVCNSGEEGLGNLKGTRSLFEAYGSRIKQFVSMDDGNLGHCINVCVGSQRYEVEVCTEGGHSFQKFGNENAIAALAKIVSAIYALEVPVIGESKTTYNVGTMQGGTSVNTIAQSASMLCEYRSNHADCLAIMEKKFKQIFEEAQTDKVRVNVRKVGDRPCSRDVDEQGQKHLEMLWAEIVTEVLDRAPTYGYASTDCNIPASLGIPAICIGLYTGEGAHTREEWIQKASLKPGMEMALKMVLRLTSDWLS